MPFGFNKEQWESLKKNQREYNLRQSKIIEEMEKNIQQSVKTPHTSKNQDGSGGFAIQ